MRIFYIISGALGLAAFCVNLILMGAIYGMTYGQIQGGNIAINYFWGRCEQGKILFRVHDEIYYCGSVKKS